MIVKAAEWVPDTYLRRLLAITVVIVAAMSVMNPRVFLGPSNLRSMAFQCPEFALLALAVMLAMLTGGIDLSIVGTALMSATLGVLLMGTLPASSESSFLSFLSVFLACAAGVAAGAVAGSINGVLVAVIRISPILATLGTMQLYSGAAVVLTGGTTIFGFPDPFVFLGNGSLAGIPVPLAIFGLAAGATGILLGRTVLGRQIYLTGDNPMAARFAGIRTRGVLIRVYLLSGMLSALAGIIMAARTNSVNAEYGASYLLLAILIAVLGGVNPSGGAGRVLGLVLAVISLQSLSSGLNMLRFSSFAKEMVWGLLLLGVMCANRMAVRSNTGEKTWPN
jgi:simple sugar transport system permease protein